MKHLFLLTVLISGMAYAGGIRIHADPQAEPNRPTTKQDTPRDVLLKSWIMNLTPESVDGKNVFNIQIGGGPGDDFLQVMKKASEKDPKRILSQNSPTSSAYWVGSSDFPTAEISAWEGVPYRVGSATLRIPNDGSSNFSMTAIKGRQEGPGSSVPEQVSLKLKNEPAKKMTEILKLSDAKVQSRVRGTSTVSVYSSEKGFVRCRVTKRANGEETCECTIGLDDFKLP